MTERGSFWYAVKKAREKMKYIIYLILLTSLISCSPRILVMKNGDGASNSGYELATRQYFQGCNLYTRSTSVIDSVKIGNEVVMLCQSGTEKNDKVALLIDSSNHVYPINSRSGITQYAYDHGFNLMSTKKVADYLYFYFNRCWGLGNRKWYLFDKARFSKDRDGYYLLSFDKGIKYDLDSIIEYNSSDDDTNFDKYYLPVEYSHIVTNSLEVINAIGRMYRVEDKKAKKRLLSIGNILPKEMPFTVKPCSDGYQVSLYLLKEKQKNKDSNYFLVNIVAMDLLVTPRGEINALNEKDIINVNDFIGPLFGKNEQ